MIACILYHCSVTFELDYMYMGHDTILIHDITQKTVISIYMIMKTSNHMCGFHLLVAIDSQMFPCCVYELQSMNHHLRIFTGIMSQLYWNFCTLNWPLLKSSRYNLRFGNFYIETLWCLFPWNKRDTFTFSPWWISWYFLIYILSYAENTASESGSYCFYLMLTYAISMLSYIVVGFGFWLLGFSRQKIHSQA